MELNISSLGVTAPLYEISMISLCFKTSAEVDPFARNSFTVQFQGQDFNLAGNCHSSILKDDHYENSISLYFEDVASFEKWRKFVTVVHRTKLKKLFQSCL